MDTIKKEDDTKELYITEIPGIINLWRAKAQNIDVVALEKEVEQIVDIKKKMDEAKSMEDNAILKKKITELGASSAIQNYMSATTADKMQKLMIEVFDKINTVLKSMRKTHINPDTAFLLAKIRHVAWFCFSIAAGVSAPSKGINDVSDFTLLDFYKNQLKTKENGTFVDFGKKDSGVISCNTATMSLKDLEEIKKHYDDFLPIQYDGYFETKIFRMPDKFLSWTDKFVNGIYDQCKKFVKK